MYVDYSLYSVNRLREKYSHVELKFENVVN
jgi:hypothetical protein